MSNQEYYQQQQGYPGGGYPQTPQPAYGAPPQGQYGSPPPQGNYGNYGPPPGNYAPGYGAPPQGGGYGQGQPPMQYQQQPPPQETKGSGKGSQNCLIACLAGICFCCAVEECCECCFECCECFC